MDQRQVIQQDPVQVKSINDFTNSLAKALVDAEGTPSKELKTLQPDIKRSEFQLAQELTRELLADGLRRALDMLGEMSKKQFLEILAANIHKFALQEQYSLSRVYPVEISSEYKNLQSFFSEAAVEEPAGERRAEPTALAELRRILSALPQKPGPSAEEFVAKLQDEESSQALKAVNARTRSAFFAEVRQSLYRLSEASQKELVESFTELKTEVVKLVDSMTQEVSVWLDEERVASAWKNQAKQIADMRGNKPRERGTVVAWKTAEYGFVKREGRHNDDIQLHVANAKGEKFKKYVRRYGMQPGVRIKFDVDFEENRGRPFASNWEMVDPPHLSGSRSRSRSGRSGRRRSKRKSPSVRRSRGSPSLKRSRASPSIKRPGRSRSKSADAGSENLRGVAFPCNHWAFLPCLEMSSEAVLSPSFQANFKHIGGGAKRAKEAFLLQTAVCLKTGEEKLYWDMAALSDLAGRMRRSFFHVEGYGELMEDWLQSRTKQLNEEFLQRGTAVLGSNFSELVSRLRQIFRPGRWMFLSDPRVEGDLITLFLEDSIPRHVLSMTSLTKLLELVGSNGGDDFHVYNDIVRLPPLTTLPCPGPQDLTESALLEVLKRLPSFPPLQRLAGGRYRFGRIEVLFQLTATELAAQVLSAPMPVPEVLRALDFFVQFGPQEFPLAAVDAVKASDSFGCGATTQIQDVNAPMLPPMAPMLPMVTSSLPNLPGLAPMPGVPPMAPLAPIGGPLGPLGGPLAMPGGMGSLAMPAFSGPKFGIDDDEI
eukprot:symbB.v1.2.011249.t2/scaffold748.1/size165754/3